MTPNSFASPYFSSQLIPLCVSFSSQFVLTKENLSYFVTDRLTSLGEWPHSGSSANLSQSHFLPHLFFWNMHWECPRKILTACCLCSTRNGCAHLPMPSVSSSNLLAFISSTTSLISWSGSSKYLNVGTCLFSNFCYYFHFCFALRHGLTLQPRQTLNWRFTSATQVL